MLHWQLKFSAEVFNEKNNRNNKEFLFAATGANKNSEAYATTNGNIQIEAFRHFLPSLGNFTDLGLVDKTSNFVYGRPNSNIFLPSKYLMDCFSEDLNDSRFRYSFISAYSSYSAESWGSTYLYNGSACAKKLTSRICSKYGIDSKWEGWTLYPHFELIDNGTGLLGVWNADGTEYTTESAGEGNILHPALPLPSPAAGEHFQYAVYCPLDKNINPADYPCLVSPVYDLYEADGTVRATDPGATTNKVSIYPALSKFNMPGEEFFGSNAQRKTNDMPVMRFAEVYLIAAEAAVRLNKSDAADYIKPLRDRAGVSTPANINMDYIYDEYARELCGEYSRWYLLKRNKAFESRLAQYNKRAASNFKSTNYVRPIPQEFLDVIHNAEEYGQNTGY